MPISFKIIQPSQINAIIPLIQKLSNNANSEAVLKQRFAEIVTQNYECAALYDRDKLIGYRKKGLGKQFMKCIYEYVSQKGYQSIELNTYVQNYPSHKFYMNEGFEILGYHFLRKL